MPEVERTKRSFPETEEKPITGDMPLNKYIAHSGECSRRDAAEMVKQGKVRVNGELILEPGYRVAPGDQVTLYGKKLTPQKKILFISCSTNLKAISQRPKTPKNVRPSWILLRMQT